MWLRTVGVEGCRGSIGEDSDTGRRVAVTVAVVDNYSSCSRRHRRPKHNGILEHVTYRTSEKKSRVVHYVTGVSSSKAKVLKSWSYMVVENRYQTIYIVQKGKVIFFLFSFDMPDLLIIASWSLKY